ncbi:uncharacterized protein LOC125698920 [Lagopus muta]|uniref:uncharacterized protein LOC125698920 n=1 Tax=Lagopus muta TaxID=64668 RepID=UPI00209CFB37|nr:uncharacterized protein LOC125698920 [Lagopus muta]
MIKQAATAGCSWDAVPVSSGATVRSAPATDCPPGAQHAADTGPGPTPASSSTCAAEKASASPGHMERDSLGEPLLPGFVRGRCPSSFGQWGGRRGARRAFPWCRAASGGRSGRDSIRVSARLRVTLRQTNLKARKCRPRALLIGGPAAPPGGDRLRMPSAPGDVLHSMREWAVVTPNFFQAVFLDIYIPSVTTWPEKYMKIKHNNCK